jgi:hypothetical protein
LKLPPVQTCWPLRNIVKPLSAATAQTAEARSRSSGTVNSLRKYRVATGAAFLAFSPGSQIHWAPDRSSLRPEGSRLREASNPIHWAFHESRPTKPIVQQAGLLQAEGLPFLSQTCTFQ